MSLHRLEIEPRDVAAEALGLLLGAPAPAALAELRLEDDDGGTLLLGLLGASHVVTADVHGSDGWHHLTEQVSCDALAGGGRPLPDRLDADSYALTSSIRRLSSKNVAALAAELRERAESRDDTVCGTFPGTDAAVTALTGSALDDGGWTWQTWHLYPGPDEGAAVETSTRWQP